IAGAALADAMFAEPVLSPSQHHRGGAPILLSEVVATAGLLFVIVALARTGRLQHVAWAVGAWIGAAYWFTASTSFANPAVTIGRTLTDTYAGIVPASAPAFIAAQLAGGAIGTGGGDACPIYPGKRYEDWDLPHPAGLGLAEVRPIRDAIRDRVQTLLNDLDPAPARPAPE